MNIQCVAPKKASLPEGDTSGWGGYSLAFNIFPPGKRWTAQSVAAEVTQNLSTYFTFTGEGKLNDAETDYITVDKAVGSAQNRSPEGPNEETYEPSPDTIYVDPSEIPSEAVNDLEEDN